MRRGVRGLRRIALSLGVLGFAALLFAPETAAHGPAPAVLDVLAHDGGAPLLLRTNVGLARARGDGTYEYVCPSRWDGNERALSVALPGGREVLALSGGTVYLSRDAGCTFAPLTSDGVYATDIAASSDAFLFIVEAEVAASPTEGANVFEVRGGRVEPWNPPLPGPADGALGTSAGFIVSGHQPMGWVRDLEGRVTSFETDATRITPRAAAGDEVWLRLASREVRLLLVADGVVALPGPAFTRAQGPVHDGTGWFALLDGVLSAYDGEWSPLSDVDWTCLRARDSVLFACRLDALWRLSSAAPFSSEPSLVFSLDQLAPPASCGGAPLDPACTSDWAHFGGEAGWVDTRAARTPGAPRRPLGGCSAGPG